MKKKFINYYFENEAEFVAYKPYLIVSGISLLVGLLITIVNLFI